MLALKRLEKYRRTGCRKLATILKNEGWKVNRKRVHRIWKELGLQVPRHQKKRRGIGYKLNACDLLKAEYPNHVWSYDFKHDVAANGRQLKFLVVIDEFTRRCLKIRVGRSCKSTDVVKTLSSLFRQHGTPTLIRSDNGPEFAAKAIQDFLKDLPTNTAFVEPGSPWQNGYCESFIAQLSSELLDGTVFQREIHAKVLTEDYRNFYNNERLHGALKYTTPDRFHETWVHDRTNGECLIKTGS